MTALRSLDEPATDALLQYFDEDACLPDLDDSPTSSGNCVVSHFLCKLLLDTGSTNEAPGSLMIVAFDVPSRMTTEVNDWYRIEHIPLLMRAPGWLRARQYQCVGSRGGRRYSSIAVHELESIDALKSAERAAARSTPWRADLSRHEWFGRAGRFLYERAECDFTRAVR